MSLCTKVGYDMLKSCWEQAYFLFDGFAIKFDWLSQQTVLNLKKLLNQFDQLVLEITYCKFHEDWKEFVACGYVLLILATFNMAAKWRPVSMRNDLLATWRGLTESPDFKNKFDIYSCELKHIFINYSAP